MVTRTAENVPDNYEPSPLVTDFHFPDGIKAIQARRFRPSTTARVECSTSLFELDETTASFLVPCRLIRVGKLAIKRIDAAASRKLRGGRGALAAPKYELSPSDKARVYELCRIFD